VVIRPQFPRAAPPTERPRAEVVPSVALRACRKQSLPRLVKSRLVEGWRRRHKEAIAANAPLSAPRIDWSWATADALLHQGKVPPLEPKPSGRSELTLESGWPHTLPCRTR
jgi:hypothetical protein